MWGAELTVNAFLGPVVGGLLLSITFALPFLVDAGSFAVAAGLVFLIAGQFRAPQAVGDERQPWQTELREGVRWLRGARRCGRWPSSSASSTPSG